MTRRFLPLSEKHPPGAIDNTPAARHGDRRDGFADFFPIDFHVHTGILSLRFALSGKPLSGQACCRFIVGQRHDHPVTKTQRHTCFSVSFSTCTIFVLHCIKLARIMHAF